MFEVERLAAHVKRSTESYDLDVGLFEEELAWELLLCLNDAANFSERDVVLLHRHRANQFQRAACSLAQVRW